MTSVGPGPYQANQHQPNRDGSMISSKSCKNFLLNNESSEQNYRTINVL